MTLSPPKCWPGSNPWSRKDRPQKSVLSSAEPRFCALSHRRPECALTALLCSPPRDQPTARFGLWFTLRAKGTFADGTGFQFNLMGQ